ncbi:MAG: hypothetical protein SVU69_09510 [Pseudomonadota bacterium]|nr:hypothetical protein [Pseudomonadota bacterium]
MQTDSDAYLVHYNTKRPHQERMMEGKTPYIAFKAGLPKDSKPRTGKAAEKAA